MSLLPNPSPTLTLELRRLLETDFAVPALWDPDKQVLLDNDAYFDEQIEAIKSGAGLAPGSVTDVQIGTRNVSDTAALPAAQAASTVLPLTLNAALNHAFRRVRSITGEAHWTVNPQTTLAAAAAHAAATASPHGATSGITANRLITRDASGRARVAAPSHPDDIARLADVQAVSGVVGTHVHDDRYYTKSELAASGSVGTNVVHADRVSAGALGLDRIPTLPPSKLDVYPQVMRYHFYGRLRDTGVPNLTLPGGWGASRNNTTGTFTVTHTMGTANYLVIPTITEMDVNGGAIINRAYQVFVGDRTSSSFQLHTRMLLDSGAIQAVVARVDFIVIQFLSA